MTGPTMDSSLAHAVEVVEDAIGGARKSALIRRNDDFAVFTNTPAWGEWALRERFDNGKA